MRKAVANAVKAQRHGRVPAAATQRSFHCARPALSAGLVVHRPAANNSPDAVWNFKAENEPKVKEIMAKFPTNYKASAVMPLLTLAQEQNDNWLPLAAMNKIAQMLDMPPIRVYEVATFYSMYNREPLGKYHLQVCGTTPCQLCGSEKILAALESKLGVGPGEITKDGMFTFTEVECLGACANAPMLQLNNHEFYENLDETNVSKLVDQLRTGGIPATTVGPQSGLQRVAEGPQGKTTLKTPIAQHEGVRDMDALVKQVKEDQEKAKAAAAAAAAAKAAATPATAAPQK